MEFCIPDVAQKFRRERNDCAFLLHLLSLSRWNVSYQLCSLSLVSQNLAHITHTHIFFFMTSGAAAGPSLSIDFSIPGRGEAKERMLVDVAAVESFCLLFQTLDDARRSSFLTLFNLMLR